MPDNVTSPETDPPNADIDDEEAARQFAEEWRQLNERTSETMRMLTEHLTVHHQSGETDHNAGPNNPATPTPPRATPPRQGTNTNQTSSGSPTQNRDNKKPATRHWYFGTRDDS